MRSRYLITHDITDDGRRNAVFKALRGFGDHLQYSVFRCDLSDRQRAAMVAVIDPLLDHHEDQVLVVDLGPVDGRASSCVYSLGRPYANPERRVIIV